MEIKAKNKADYHSQAEKTIESPLSTSLTPSFLHPSFPLSFPFPHLCLSLSLNVPVFLNVSVSPSAFVITLAWHTGEKLGF